MSAFLCSEKHVHALVLFAKDHGLIAGTPQAQCAAATSLRRLNNAALKARYGDRPVGLKHSPAEIFAAREWLETHSAAAIAAIARCFQHQCAEGGCEAHKDWPLLQRIVAKADELGKYGASEIWAI